MKNFLFLLVVVTIFLSCKNNNSGTTSETNTDTTAVMNTDTIVSAGALSNGMHCYKFIMKQDTYSIDLTLDNNIVTGNMSFKNYEKDSSKGTIKGTLNGDVLNVNYRFNSEGMSSVRNINFKVAGKVLITGTGEEKSVGDSAFIADPATIRYDGIMYDEVDCNK